MKSEPIQQRVQSKTDDRNSRSPFFAFLCDLLLNRFLSGHSSQKGAKNRKGLDFMFTRSSLRLFAIFCNPLPPMHSPVYGVSLCSRVSRISRFTLRTA